MFIHIGHPNGLMLVVRESASKSECCTCVSPQFHSKAGKISSVFLKQTADIFHVLYRNVKVSQIIQILNTITSVAGHGKNTVANAKRNVLVKATGRDAGKTGVIGTAVQYIPDPPSFFRCKGNRDIFIAINEGQCNLCGLIHRRPSAGAQRDHHKKKQ